MTNVHTPFTMRNPYFFPLTEALAARDDKNAIGRADIDQNFRQAHEGEEKYD